MGERGWGRARRGGRGERKEREVEGECRDWDTAILCSSIHGIVPLFLQRAACQTGSLTDSLLIV